MKNLGYSIWIDTICEGTVPAVRDGAGQPFVFPTERDAQVEIVEQLITRLDEFLDGQREFEDAMTVEEYVSAMTADYLE